MKPALLLNADFRPLSLFPLSKIEAEKAIKGIYEGTHTVVAEYPDQIARSPSMSMKVPSVVALTKYVPAPRYVAFTRFNVFLRDRFRCQYCGERFKSDELTFDHVIPRAKGGRTEWDNIVAACIPCNAEKDDQYRQPRTHPRQPTPAELLRAQRDFPPAYLHESWLDYLYWDSPIEA